MTMKDLKAQAKAIGYSIEFTYYDEIRMAPLTGSKAEREDKAVYLDTTEDVVRHINRLTTHPNER